MSYHFIINNFKKKLTRKKKVSKKNIRHRAWKKRTRIRKIRFMLRNFKKKKHALYTYKTRLYRSLLLRLVYAFRYSKNINYNFFLRPSFTFRRRLFLFDYKIRKKFFLFNFFKINFRFKQLLINPAYNNFTPLYNLPFSFVKRFRKKFKSIIYKKYFTNIQFHIVTFLEYFFQKKFYIKALNNNIMKRKRLYRKIRLKRLKKIYKRFRRSVLTRNNKFNLYELLEIIFHSFFYKDIYFLKNWFLLNYIKLHYKNQKKFLSLFRVFVSNVFFFIKIFLC